MSVRLRLTGAVALFAAMLLTGCKPSNPHAPAKVTGKVSYNGSAVTGGSVSFHYKDGAMISSPINRDGTYSAVDIPQGEVVVTVETESINPENKKVEYRSPVGAGMAAKYGKGGSAKAPSGGGGGGKGSPMSPAPEGSGSDTTYIKIPKKYSDKGTSGLTATITDGKQTANFDLVD